MIKIKNYRHNKIAVKQLKAIKIQIKQIFDEQELKQLINLKAQYNNIFNSKSTIIKINKLLRVLLISTGYLERLTAIKMDLTLLNSRAYSISNKLELYLKSQKEFKSLKVKDREIVLEIENKFSNQICEELETKIDIINDLISFIDKLQFAVKTSLSTLKSNTEKR